MGLWKIPAKIKLPAEPDDGPCPFEFNGKLPNGDQVMAFVGERRGKTYPLEQDFTTFVAAVLRFNADGVLLSCHFNKTSHGAGYLEQDEERSRRTAREQLEKLLEPVLTGGWKPADIMVRPFFIMIEGLETGLIYQTAGDDGDEDAETEGYSPEHVMFLPAGYVFYRPWTTGEYDT
ncbi:hypothetical protein [Zavarzinella formosa]|uniref:hypothetical protein n=1 Tax=Zavarzinella formosa TaxID=360055 RepID=UPI000303188D|nr:hypothetical protein [Zavarzinella formosa]